MKLKTELTEVEFRFRVLDELLNETQNMLYGFSGPENTLENKSIRKLYSDNSLLVFVQMSQHTPRIREIFHCFG